MDFSRRSFLKSLGLTVGSLSIGDGLSARTTAGHIPARPALSQYMGGFKAPRLDKIRVVFIGVGGRGASHVHQMCLIEGVEIVGICDLKPHLVENAVKHVSSRMGKSPRGYDKGPKDYLNMLRDLKPDAAIISTDWATHAPIAIDSMKNSSHAFVEVPLAVTLEELWEIVDTSEKTQKHCMMLENVNYGREELLFLNMCRRGAIGDLLHGEAAYIHRLIDSLGANDGEGSWRPHYMVEHNGNMYPSHGLGPVAQYMNLAREEDQFSHLVSFSSPSLGAAAWAKKHLPAEHKWNKAKFICGDINNTLIKTSLGRTILVQWDELTPRPYSRLNLIQGTLGTLAGFPTRVAGEKLGNGNYHDWIQGEAMNAIYEEYEHPLWKSMGRVAEERGGHGGMDFIMLYRIVKCLREGLPMDQNVYEGAFWSSVMPLSWQSVASGGIPVTFPDFTRGEWKKTAPLEIVSN